MDRRCQAQSIVKACKRIIRFDKGLTEIAKRMDRSGMAADQKASPRCPALPAGAPDVEAPGMAGLPVNCVYRVDTTCAVSGCSAAVGVLDIWKGLCMTMLTG
jgi:hypothetical protein